MKDRILPHCIEGSNWLNSSKDYLVNKTRPDAGDPNSDRMIDQIETDQVAWIWILIFAYATPELVGVFLRSLRMVLFKTFKRPCFADFLFILFMESMHVIGLVTLVFLAFPQLDSTHVVILTSCFGSFPAILNLLSRTRTKTKRDGYLQKKW